MNIIVKRILWVTAGMTAVGLAGFALLLYMTFAPSDEFAKRPYNRNEWLHGTNGNQMKFPRLGMADYLIEEKKLNGKKRNEVLFMLGKPSMEDIEWSENDYFDLLYWLGPERGFMSVDSEWLGIKFDKKETVKEYKLVRD